MSVKVNLNQIIKLLKKNPIVIGAWIFGSAKDGIIKDGSDLDIGILFDKSYKKHQILDLHIQFVKETDIDKVDISDLNTASAILRFEAISGNQIYTKDEEKTVEFFSLTCRKYEDDMALIEKNMQYYREFNK